MKRYLLSYNPITKGYNLDYGCFDRQRKFLRNVDGEELIKRIKEIFQKNDHMQKKIILYSEISLDDSIKELLLKDFKNTSVKVQFAKNLESLCKDKAKI
jgi:hypothetical protein